VLCDGDPGLWKLQRRSCQTRLSFSTGFISPCVSNTPYRRRAPGAGTSAATSAVIRSANWRAPSGDLARVRAHVLALGSPEHWFDAGHVRDVKGAVAARRHINDLIEYLDANRLALVNYGRRRHDQLPISTAFVESAVNEILSKRMIKKQQMRWNRWTVQAFLDVRVAVLNKTLAGSFRRLYPDFRSDNESYQSACSMMSPHDFACSQSGIAMSEPGGDPSSGSAWGHLRLPKRHAACKRREAAHSHPV